MKIKLKKSDLKVTRVGNVVSVSHRDCKVTGRGTCIADAIKDFCEKLKHDQPSRYYLE